MYVTSDSLSFGSTSNMQNYIQNLQLFIYIGHLKSIRLHLKTEKMHAIDVIALETLSELRK
jgi:hypothetical protein